MGCGCLEILPAGSVCGFLMVIILIILSFLLLRVCDGALASQPAVNLDF